ncbi:MAG TPA: PspC domain-containing protein [Allosphingosinicella sp.]|jgi:phage shock protein PspC (stress-responsive transcriptional regulator)
MQSYQPYLFNRSDTFFGVCEGLGEDFGFNANYLRVALALAIFWNPVMVAGGYAGAGVIVALSRWLVPNPRPAPAVEAAETPMPANTTEPAEALPLAA